ncbi:hypothetical protein AJ80_02058 [Polytolypa hystricis UAMH7299]|uniref:Uncharacterized protein n=1 Tax=Polytolypa hystricis (strain UAMH7299) TaxID=1447883 RepID=A0A2B7YRK6_POLH7|nr:hypothetical protein AJ80_02058 [Polytolypa hystricis UAMH7299]
MVAPECRRNNKSERGATNSASRSIRNVKDDCRDKKIMRRILIYNEGGRWRRRKALSLWWSTTKSNVKVVRAQFSELIGAKRFTWKYERLERGNDAITRVLPQIGLADAPSLHDGL